MRASIGSAMRRLPIAALPRSPTEITRPPTPAPSLLFAAGGGPLLQGVDGVLNRRADALADADRLQSREPEIPRIAGLEEWRHPQRRACVRRLADAVVGHQNHGPIVGFQREAN